MIKRLSLIGLAATASSASVAQPAAPSAPPVDKTLIPYANAADAVTLPDGRKLHMVCMGKGSPTVILTAGAGDFSGTGWSTVQSEMAKITRTCAWDRPGFGLSDGTMKEVSVTTTTDDLEAALAAGRITGPYVMVGHSIGSYESLLFTDRHPDKVAGMVLVDPSVPGALALVGPGRMAGRAPLEAMYRTCVADIRAGTVKSAGPGPDPCTAFFPPTWPPALREAVIERAANPSRFEAMFSFMNNVRDSMRQAVNLSRNYRDMPLIVLTAGDKPALPPGVSLTEEQKAKLADEEAQTARGQKELAALSTRGKDLQVPGANHYIQRTQPQAVIDAVAEVVREARTSRD